MENQREALAIGIALSLYAFNVSPLERAKALYNYFEGDCAELEDLVLTLAQMGTYAMTELPFPTARVYLQHAWDKYGLEALERVDQNM